jgi:hypothetical protein
MLRAEALQPRAPAAAPVAIPRMEIPPAGEIGGTRPPTPPASPIPPPPPPLPSGPAVSASFAALGDINTSIPPDTNGAAGPAHLMTMLNTQVRIQNKAGGTVSTVTLSTFWTAGTGLFGSPFDPHVVYDSISSRWIATVDANGNSATSQVWFAISATSDPTLGWTFYGFAADPAYPVGTTWADYPGMGVNGTWIAITNNMFTVAGSPAFVGAKMWVIDKATALAGGPLTTTVFFPGFDSAGGVFGFTLKPAVTYSAAEPTLYIVDNSGWSSGGTFLVRLSRITGTGPAPVWSVVPGSPFAGTGFFFVVNNFDFAQINAAQAGTATLIDSGDPRASDSVYRNSRLWFAHSGGLPVGGVNRTAVFWYQVNPAAMPAPIVQSGVLDGGLGVHHTYPSIAANASDDACMGFSRSHAGIFIEAVGTSRFAGQAPGTMDPIMVLKAGEDSYVKDYGTGTVRWGDYSATSIDPVDGGCWTIQEYAVLDVGPGSSDDRWGTWWARFGGGASTTSTTSSTTTSSTSSTTATTTSTTSTTVATTSTTGATTSSTTSSTTVGTTSTTSTTLPVCLNVGGSPSPIVLKKTLLKFAGAGLDRFTAKGTFTTATPFDPATTDTTYVTISDSGAGTLWASGAITSGTLEWAGSNPPAKRFKYNDPTAAVIAGLQKIVVKESPAGSNTYKLVIKGKLATLLAGPPTVGTHQVLVEFSTPLCFGVTATTCTKMPTKEKCF